MVIEAMTRVDHVLSMIQKQTPPEGGGLTYPLSLRLPIVLAAQITAFAQHSGQSKNRIVIELLELAIEEVAPQLSDEDSGQIQALLSKFLIAETGLDDAYEQLIQSKQEA